MTFLIIVLILLQKPIEEPKAQPIKQSIEIQQNATYLTGPAH